MRSWVFLLAAGMPAIAAAQQVPPRVAAPAQAEESDQAGDDVEEIVVTG